MREPWDDYAAGVRDGKVLACRELHLAVGRWYAMRENPAYTFDAAAVRRVVGFVRLLRHYTGRHDGEPFTLQPWQSFIVAAIYGFKYKATGLRVVRSVYLEMARKQGKSALAAALCLCHLIADGEANAEVYLAANSKDQAKIAFGMCSNFAKTIDPKGNTLRPFRDRILFDKTRSLLRVLASDDSKLDGFNASMFLLDEYHAAKDSRLKDVLQSSQGMREQPMKIIITTAGFDKLGVCYQYRTMCEEVLAGAKKDDTLFAAIFTLDEGDDWKDEKVWIKSNPNLGITVSAEYLREQVNIAANSPSEEVGIKTKNINVWCDASDTWIADRYILDACAKVGLDELAACPLVFCGIDLSSTSDLTAAALMGVDEENGRFLFHVRYYLPEAALDEKRFKIQYGEWRRQGLLTVTAGNVTDYDYVLNDLREADKKCLIQKIGYDSWNSTQFVINATDAGLPMQPFSQTIGNFNKPTKELERLLLSGRVKIDNNEITRRCFRNIVMAIDRNGNTKPTKQFAEKKIDGVIAMIEALGVYLDNPMSGDVSL